MPRPTIIAGNWKLNPPRAQGEQLFRDIVDGVRARPLRASGCRVVICPPAPYLGWCRGMLDAADLDSGAAAVELGAQDLSADDWGAFTGDLGGELLREFGARFVVLGHSERRQLRGETDARVARKLCSALAVGLVPILCVGETDAERDAGETFEVVRRQLEQGLETATREGKLAAATFIVVAYEPVWAIGTGRTATPGQAAEVHRYLRNRLVEFGRARWQANQWADTVPILYGGSVKPDNARELLADADIDGALVGGASLAAGSLLAIVDAGIQSGGKARGQAAR